MSLFLHPTGVGVAGLSMRDGDIVSLPTTRSALICPAKSCLWPKSVDGFVYIPYIISPFYGEHIKHVLPTQSEFRVSSENFIDKVYRVLYKANMTLNDLQYGLNERRDDFQMTWTGSRQRRVCWTSLRRHVSSSYHEPMRPTFSAFNPSVGE